MDGGWLFPDILFAFCIKRRSDCRPHLFEGSQCCPVDTPQRYDTIGLASQLCLAMTGVEGHDRNCVFKSIPGALGVSR